MKNENKFDENPDAHSAELQSHCKSHRYLGYNERNDDDEKKVFIQHC